MTGVATVLRGALRILVFAALADAAGHAQVTPTMDGRSLYQGHIDFTAGPNSTSYRLPREFTACAKCHGRSGEGGREGSLAVPALRWTALTRPRGELPAFTSDDRIVDAITKGIGRDGQALGRAMPRFDLTDGEAKALLDYLRRIGGVADLPPGVDRSKITLGALLPLSGAAGPIGRSALLGLRDVFDEVNAGGGVHGRRIELHILDIAYSDVRQATSELLARSPYAVVAGMWAPDKTVRAQFSDRRVAKIANLIPHDRSFELDEWDIDLLPPLDKQQEAFADALRTCPAPLPRWVVPILPGTARTAPGERWFDSVQSLRDALADANGPACVVSGLAYSGDFASAFPEGSEQRLVLPFPAALFSDLGDRSESDLWRRLGQAAARLTVELLARAGAQLHEYSLVTAFSGFWGFEPLSGAPVRSNRLRRYAWDADTLVIPAPVVAASERTNVETRREKQN